MAKGNSDGKKRKARSSTARRPSKQRQTRSSGRAASSNVALADPSREFNLNRAVGKPTSKEQDRSAEYDKQSEALRKYLRENEKKKVEETESFTSKLLREKQKKRAPIIGFYNFKGGVGKTSNLINTAARLAKEGKRVLAIDADPQCNLTNFYRPPICAGDEEADEEADNSCVETGDDKAGSNDRPNLEAIDITGDDEDNREVASSCIKNVVDVVPFPLNRASETSAVDIELLRSKVEEEGARDLYDLLRPAFQGDMSAVQPALMLSAAPMPHVGDPPSIFYIPGSPHISEFESALSLTAAQTMTSCMFRGAFRKILVDTALLHEIDFVLVDFGPSVSTMNKVFLLSCDYILPPLFADFFSLISMEVLLEHVIPTLIKDRETIERDEKRYLDTKQKLLGFAFNPSVPKVFPFIVTNFGLYQGKHLLIQPGRFVVAMRQLIMSKNIPDSVATRFVRPRERMVCPLCRNLQQLQHLSHDYSIAPSAWTTAGLQKAMSFLAAQRVSTYETYRQEAEQKYESFAKFVIAICS